MTMNEKETRTTIKVPTELWKRFRVAVVLEGVSLQAKIRELIEEYLKNKEAS
jgi:predicted DNA binding CopG/RHH family protein